MANSRWQRSCLALLYAASGFGTLALETLWIREITLRVGGTLIAVSLVVGTFFAAAALGNLWGAGLAARIRRPLAGYGWLELASAGSAIGLFHLARSPWLGATHALWVHAGGLVLAVLLVGIPAFLSGASFPLLSEQVVRTPAERLAGGGVLYGANLLGAAAGVLAGAVVLPWYWGMGGAFLSAGGVLVAGGLLALLAAGKWGWGGVSNPSQADDPQQNAPVGRPFRAASPQAADTRSALQKHSRGWDSRFYTLLVFFFCGALSLAAQGLLISWARQILQGSVYTLSGVLATFIFGLGTGALLAAGLRRKGCRPPGLFAGFGLAAALQLILLPWAGGRLVSGMPPAIGVDPLGMLGFTTGWSLLLLLPLATCLGTLFPLAWEMWKGGENHQGRALGQIIAANKLGAALGVGLGVFAILPAFGLQGGTCFVGTGYALLVAGLLLRCPFPGSRVVLAASVMLAGAGVLRTLGTHPALGLSADEKERATYHGPYGPVSVVEQAGTGSRHIVLNTRQRLNGTGRALSTQFHQAWIPLFLAGPVDRVAAIGMASGITASGVLDFPVRDLYAIELVPGVVRAARDHFQPWSGRLFSDPRAHIMQGDGRQVLRALEGPFDGVICDLLFPQEEGTANLYSGDFFREVRGRLRPGGVFCLWLPCYQLDDRSIGIILRTFADVFPGALVVRANFDPLQPVIGLVGSPSPLRLDRDTMREKIARLASNPRLAQSPFFRSPDHAWLSVVGVLQPGLAGLADRPATTDDRPLLACLGPADAGPGGRLVGMPFAKWEGRIFGQSDWPGDGTGTTPPSDIMASVRAARAYYIASVADTVIEGDRRPESVRLSQTALWLARAREANPAALLPREALGQ